MTQPTIDELKARIGSQGKHVKYAGVPGTGPKGKTCHDCAFLKYTGNSRKRYPKCGKTAYTHGDATTIRTRTPACSLFAVWQPKPGVDMGNEAP